MLRTLNRFSAFAQCSFSVFTDIRLTTEYVVAAMGGGVLWLDLAIVVTLEEPVPDSATFFGVL